MIGQYTNEEMEALFQSKPHQHGRNYELKTAWVNYGKYTTNYYQQHEDGSWTNYDCKTKY